MDLCGGRDICRVLAARRYGYAHGDGGRIEYEFLGLAPDCRPFAAQEGVDVLAGLGPGGDLARLAALEPGALFVLNYRTVADWLAARAGRDPGGPSPEVRRSAREWGLAAMGALGAAGVRVLEWKVGVDEPSHVLDRLAALWAHGPDA